jgi:hypothetical protein
MMGRKKVEMNLDLKRKGFAVANILKILAEIIIILINSDQSHKNSIIPQNQSQPNFPTIHQ